MWKEVPATADKKFSRTEQGGHATCRLLEKVNNTDLVINRKYKEIWN